MTDLLERRHTSRYKLTNPVDFWWLAPSGSVQASHGTTLDISSSGVIVIARKCPPKGVRIQMTIHFARHNGSGCPLELHGEGIVVRIEPGKATQPSQRSSRFAASVHFYSESLNDSDARIRMLVSPRNTLTAGRVEESSDYSELFRHSRRSGL